jgi:hypothetical protein
MKKEKHPSDSTEQQLAHREILLLINQLFNLNLVSKKLLLENTLFQVDGYSEDPAILCEIYSRIGPMKVAQHNKISKDILKMLLIEKMSGKQYRKIITFADEDAAQPFLDSESWYSQLKEQFNIEILIIKISEELKNNLLEAQKRQYR